MQAAEGAADQLDPLGLESKHCRSRSATRLHYQLTTRDDKTVWGRTISKADDYGKKNLSSCREKAFEETRTMRPDWPRSAGAAGKEGWN